MSKKFTLFGGFSAFAVFGRVNLPECSWSIVGACGGASGIGGETMVIATLPYASDIITLSGIRDIRTKISDLV